VVDQTLTVFTQPTPTGYQQSAAFKSGDTFRLAQFPDVEIAMSELGW